MGKLDELRRLAGANVDDSMGVNRVARPVETATAPARWQGVVKSKNTAEIPPAKIIPDPEQPRTEFDEEGIARLADSLKTRGQLAPIRVRWDDARGLYVIVCGERRWRAAVKAEMPMLSCVVVDGPLDAAELLSIQLVENALREDLKPLEQAKAFKTLMDRNGWSARHVARELNYPQSTMVKILELLELPGPIQDRVERGEIAVTTAYELRRIDSPAEQIAVADAIAAGSLTRTEASEVIERKASPARARAAKGKGGKAKPRPPVDDRPRRMPNGVKIRIEATPRHTLEDVREALRVLLDQLDTSSAQEAA